MHGLILAGGEGTRLAADGVAAPKALAAVGGRAQLVSLVEQFTSLGCESITCLVHEDVAEQIASTAQAEVARVLGERATIVGCRTPSSLHTLAAGLARVSTGDVFCSMVDSVMAADDWHALYDASARFLAAGADAVLAVTPYANDDDAPLWAQVDDQGIVTRIGGGASTPPLITGGVYAFAPRARARVPQVLAAGRSRMRAFLADLVDSGAPVRAVEIERIIDIDHKRDLDEANAYVASRVQSAARSPARAER